MEVTAPSISHETGLGKLNGSSAPDREKWMQ